MYSIIAQQTIVRAKNVLHDEKHCMYDSAFSAIITSFELCATSTTPDGLMPNPTTVFTVWKQ